MPTKDAYTVTMEFRIEGHLASEITVEVSDSQTLCNINVDNIPETPIVLEMVLCVALYAVTENEALSHSLANVMASHGMMPFGTITKFPPPNPTAN